MMKKGKGKINLLKHIKNIAPYQLTKTEQKGNLLLNRNENFFVPREFQEKLVQKAIKNIDVRLYEEPFNLKIVENLSKFHDIPINNLYVGNGSDEIIFLLPRLIMDNTKNALIPSPSFSPYASSVLSVGGKIKKIPLTRSFELPIQDFKKEMDQDSVLTYLAVPNNPTGNIFSKDSILEIIEDFPGIVVIDEAYGPLTGISYINELKKYDNLVILRTFSKVFGAAGIRIGYCIGHSDLIDGFRLINQPYNLDSLQQMIACEILNQIDSYDIFIKELKEERNKWFKEMNELDGISPVPSETNFILFETDYNADILFNELVKHKIVVRKQNIEQMKNSLRVTIGPENIRIKFIEALKKSIDNIKEKK
ncbi:MAG: histidinol-phosphate transaminase [Candidatus Ranarchaeia archaeon]